MSYCQICGDDRGAEFRLAKGMTLCPTCDREKPIQERGFEKFCKVMDFTLPQDERTAREFYDDYRHSNRRTFAAYRKDTVKFIWE